VLEPVFDALCRLEIRTIKPTRRSGEIPKVTHDCVVKKGQEKRNPHRRMLLVEEGPHKLAEIE